nr:MAG TPA: hypothetical protein [Caudoviricetes sp.]
MRGVCPKCPIFFQHIYIYAYLRFSRLYIRPFIHIFIFLFLYK